MTVDRFFDIAEKENWLMSWEAWKILVVCMTGSTIWFDDSGYKKDYQVCAQKARIAMVMCTIT